MSIQPLTNRYVLLGVTGSIAAYKAVDLASKLTQAGAQVDTLLTQSGTRFVTPITFQSVTGRKAYTDADLWGDQAHVLHVKLAHQVDMMIIAPATANTIAKLAHGIADNIVCLIALSIYNSERKPPLIIAPAMDGGMYQHPATQDNIRILKERGGLFIGPEAGHLASGMTALGRMSEPQVIFNQIRYMLTRDGPLAGKTIVVTAGGTQEALDPIRVLTNHSSGKQGFAIAQAAMDAGADVILISAPVSLPIPFGVEYIQVRSASQMEKAVLDSCPKADALIMAAAVADFRPKLEATQKIKKGAGLPKLELELTPDILASVAAVRQKTSRPNIVIGFAAETENLIENARTKLKLKGLDLIVANDVSASDSGFGTDTNRVTFVLPDGSVETLPLMSKAEVAASLIQRLIPKLGRKV